MSGSTPWKISKTPFRTHPGSLVFSNRSSGLNNDGMSIYMIYSARLVRNLMVLDQPADVQVGRSYSLSLVECLVR